MIATLAVPAAGWGLGQHAWRLANSWPQVWEIDDAIALGASATGAVVAAYLTLTGVAMALTSALSRGRRSLPRGIAPEAWRRLVAVAWGVGLTSGLAGPALAAENAAPSAGWDAGTQAVATQVADAGVAGPQVGWGAVPGGSAGDAIVIDAVALSDVTPAAGWSLDESAPALEAATDPIVTDAAPTDAVAEAAPAVGFGGTIAAAAATAREPLPDPEPTPEAATPAVVVPPVAEAPPTPPPGLDAPVTAPAPAAQGAPTSAYVVQPGDSLWTIAADMLGPDATDAQITQGWHAIYDANRAAIGSNPGLIHAGLALEIPVEVAR